MNSNDTTNVSNIPSYKSIRSNEDTASSSRTVKHLSSMWELNKIDEVTLINEIQSLVNNCKDDMSKMKLMNELKELKSESGGAMLNDILSIKYDPRMKDNHLELYVFVLDNIDDMGKYSLQQIEFKYNDALNVIKGKNYPVEQIQENLLKLFAIIHYQNKNVNAYKEKCNELSKDIDNLKLRVNFLKSKNNLSNREKAELNLLKKNIKNMERNLSKLNDIHDRWTNMLNRHYTHLKNTINKPEVQAKLIDPSRLGFMQNLGISISQVAIDTVFDTIGATINGFSIDALKFNQIDYTNSFMNDLKNVTKFELRELIEGKNANKGERFISRFDPNLMDKTSQINQKEDVNAPMSSTQRVIADLVTYNAISTAIDKHNSNPSFIMRTVNLVSGTVGSILNGKIFDILKLR